jgi:hypothetical protein
MKTLIVLIATAISMPALSIERAVVIADIQARTITIDKLASDFQANEMAAVAKYKTELIVTGKARNVSITLNTPTVNMANGVRLFMRRNVDSNIADVAPGDVVTVVCARARSAMTMVAAYDCVPWGLYVAQRMKQ